jgi:Phage integrase, N-terminal SAM-like domain
VRICGGRRVRFPPATRQLSMAAVTAGLFGGFDGTERSVTFAEAAEEYLRYAERDRGCKPSTIRNYRSMLKAHLLPAFGSTRIEDIG